MSKTCNICKTLKNLSDFHNQTRSKDGRQSKCKSCSKAINAASYKRNPDKNRLNGKRYRENNKDKVKARKQVYTRNNREKINAARRKRRAISSKDKIYEANRYLKDKARIRNVSLMYRSKPETKKKTADRHKKRSKVDINFKLQNNLRRRLHHALKKNFKKGSAVKDLGCSIAKFKIHIQLKFHRNPRGKHEYMTWDNYGKYGWHIDHIIPISSFDLTTKEGISASCHYTNLRPMWAIDNIKKGAKLL